MGARSLGARDVARCVDEGVDSFLAPLVALAFLVVG